MTASETTGSPAGTAGARRARPVLERRTGVKVGDLASGRVVTAGPGHSVRQAARSMRDHGVGSVVVLDDGEQLVGILTERDVLHAVATGTDLDATPVAELMTLEVVTAGPDWEVYEAAAEMTAQRIRHLVVTRGQRVLGVLSIRDVLLAGQRVELTDGNWAVLRDPLTFTIRERRRLQRALLLLDRGPVRQVDLDGLIGELVGSWSFDVALPADAEALAALPESDRELLRDAVREELPDLQRAVHPAPGWRRWRG
ncbi:MAG TPA: CBS domain-containing protein [Nitriliruptorales bacterium]|nr:CBS domain-containing protein [Nitriliruptorales bacterium]